MYLKDYIALANMKEVFQEIASYIIIKNKNGSPSIEVFDKKDKTVFSQPLVLLDNIPFQDYSKLLNTPPSKIVSIKVIAEPYVCGNEIMYGIVSIHSATGDLAGLGLPKNVAAVDYITLNPSATISYDEYIQSVNADKRTPDFRSTLYWNPNIVLTNEDQSLQFYTSDCTCDYDIIIRGIDANGEPIFSSKTITVVK